MLLRRLESGGRAGEERGRDLIDFIDLIVNGRTKGGRYYCFRRVTVRILQGMGGRRDAALKRGRGDREEGRDPIDRIDLIDCVA